MVEERNEQPGHVGLHANFSWNLAIYRAQVSHTASIYCGVFHVVSLFLRLFGYFNLETAYCN